MVRIPEGRGRVGRPWPPTSSGPKGRRLALLGTVAATLLVVAGQMPALAVFGRISSTGANTLSTATLQSPAGLAVNIACTGGVQFRSSGTGSTNGGSAITVARPSGVQLADVMLAVLSWDQAVSIVAPVGWTTIREDVQTTLNSRQKLFYRVATAAEPSTYTFTATGAAPEEGVGVVSAYSGVNTTSPIDVHGGQAQTGAPDTLITAPSVTPGTPGGRMLVGFFSTSSQGAITSAAGMVERAEIQVATADGYALEVADEAIPAVVATGTRVAQQVGVNDLSVGQVVVLRGADGSTASSANVNWTATPSPFAAGYTLRRWNGAVLEGQQTVTPRSTQRAVDGLLTNGTTYRFELEAVYESWTSTTVNRLATPACAPPARPFSCPADANLHACIRFDANAGGTYVDESGYANTVTHTNGILVPGVSGSAARSGATTRYQMVDSASLDLVGAMTIETWVRLDSLPATGRAGIIDNDGQFGLIIYPSTGLQCSNNLSQAPPVVVPTNVWFHAACVWNGATLVLYIDGMPVSTTPSVGANDTSNTNPIALLNTSPAFDEPMDGTMDNLRIWQSARTQAQICADAGLTGC